MSAGKAKRMLVHIKKDEEWNTLEFLSIADAKRYLRAEGLKFKDEDAFFNPEFGTIVDEDRLIEIEEAFEQEERLELFGKTYVPLSHWCTKNGIDYKTGVALISKKKMSALKIGRKGRVFVDEGFVNVPYKKRPIQIEGINYIPLSVWAKKNGVDYNKAHYLCRKDCLKHVEIPVKRLKKIYIYEGERLHGQR